MTIAISCGEPAGIGPEVAAAAWEMLRSELALLWIGDPRHLPEGTSWQAVSDPSEAADLCPRALPVLVQDFGSDVTPGTPKAEHAPRVIAAIETGVELVQSGQCSGLCTAPIHKQALIDGAGFGFPGHTEFLAHMADLSSVVMMLASNTLRVVPVTIHVPLTDVPSLLTTDLLFETLDITRAALIRDFGLTDPRIAVAGLNPHAGESGKIGREDRDVIAPVVAACRDRGWHIAGPMSADTMFHEAARSRYDVAVCMYHDQALIPIKTLAFDEGVNVTLGLPFVRTSPDHGTALDIAGQGRANPTSMVAALRMAARMSTARSDQALAIN